MTTSPSSPLTHNLRVSVPEGPPSLHVCNQQAPSQSIFTARSFFFQRVEIPGRASLRPSTLAEQGEPRHEAASPARPYLHAANVNGEHGREEEHLQEEVGHQADHSEEAELLQAAHTHTQVSYGSSGTGVNISSPGKGQLSTLLPGVSVFH